MKYGAFLSIVTITALFATAGCSHGPRHSNNEDPVPTTVDIQGANEWKRSPYMRAYYDATVATFANGTDIDVDAYETRESLINCHSLALPASIDEAFQSVAHLLKSGKSIDQSFPRSFDLFREFARAKGVSEEGMVDHLKLIPRQIVQIVKENRAVLKDYDTFWAALAGPD